MLNKKTVLFGTIILAFIFFSASVSAVGGYPAPSKNIKCIESPGYEHFYDPIGCSCEVTSVFASSSLFPMRSELVGIEAFHPGWKRVRLDEFGNPEPYMGDFDFLADGMDDAYYCYVTEDEGGELGELNYPGKGVGLGKIKMCTNDYYTYNNSPGVTGHPECTVKINTDFSYDMDQRTFCENNRCQKICFSDSDCSSGLYASTTKCLKGNYFGKFNSCTSCNGVSGTLGDNINNGVVIAMLFKEGGAETYLHAYDLAAKIVKAQPFKHLHENNLIKFQYVQAGFDKFVNVVYKPEGERFFLFNQAEDEINKLIFDTCPEADYGVYIDSLNTSFGQANAPRRESIKTVFLENNDASLVIHELGHSIANLGDEYVSPFSAVSSNRINIDKLNAIEIPWEFFYVDKCLKFDSLGIPSDNCFEIKSTFARSNDPLSGIRSEITYKNRKSTEESSMNLNRIEPRYNLISCAAMLNAMGPFGFEQSMDFCKTWACQNEIVGNTGLECPYNPNA